MLKMNTDNNRFIKVCDLGLMAVHKFAQQSHTQDRYSSDMRLQKYSTAEFMTQKQIFIV
jgi:hypothetical protein